MLNRIPLKILIPVLLVMCMMVLVACGRQEPKDAAQKLGELIGQGKYKEATETYLQIGQSLKGEALTQEIARMGAMFDMIKTFHGDLKSITVNEVSKEDKSSTEQIIWHYANKDASVILEGSNGESGWKFTPKETVSIGTLNGTEMENAELPPDPNVLGAWTCSDGDTVWKLNLTPDGVISLQADENQSQDPPGDFKLHTGTFKPLQRSDLNRGVFEITGLVDPYGGRAFVNGLQYLIHGKTLAEYYGIEHSLVVGPPPSTMTTYASSEDGEFNCQFGDVQLAQNSSGAAVPQATTGPTRPPEPTDTPVVAFRINILGMDGETEARDLTNSSSFPTVTISGGAFTQPKTLERYRYDELPVGEYQVKVEFPPYLPKTQTFTLKEAPSSETQDINVQLEMVPLDSKNLVMAGTAVYNYLTGERVANLPYQLEQLLGVRSSDKTKFVTESYGFINLDGTGRGGIPFENIRYISWSPDRKQVVYVQDNDLWLAEPDWNALELNNPHQVTQVGVFNDFTDINAAWSHDGKHIVALNGDAYWVDLDTGEVKDAPVGWYMLLEQRISPDQQTIVGKGDDNAYVYDVTTNTRTELRQIQGGRDFCWMSNSQVAILLGNTELWVVSADGQTAKMIADTNADYAPQCSAGYIITDEDKVYDGQSGQAIPLPEGVQRTDWLNDHTLVLSRTDQGFTNLKVEDRGTWLLNLETNQLTRVTPYPFETLHVIPDENLMIFNANDALWSANLDGSNVKQIVKFDNTFYGTDVKELKMIEF